MCTIATAMIMSMAPQSTIHNFKVFQLCIIWKLNHCLISGLDWVNSVVYSQFHLIGTWLIGIPTLSYPVYNVVTNICHTHTYIQTDNVHVHVYVHINYHWCINRKKLTPTVVMISSSSAVSLVPLIHSIMCKRSTRK